MSEAPDLSVVRDEASKKAASSERTRIRNIQELCLSTTCAIWLSS